MPVYLARQRHKKDKDCRMNILLPGLQLQLIAGSTQERLKVKFTACHLIGPTCILVY